MRNVARSAQRVASSPVGRDAAAKRRRSTIFPRTCPKVGVVSPKYQPPGFWLTYESNVCSKVFVELEEGDSSLPLITIVSDGLDTRKLKTALSTSPNINPS